jgi:hypothetical protein
MWKPCGGGEVKKSWIFVVALSLILICSTFSPAQAQDEGFTIYGVVYNGTPSGQVPEDLPINLYVFTDGIQSGSFESVIDESGVFVFEGLTLSEGDQVIATTDYLDVTYMSSSFTYEADQEIPDLSLAIYETTEDPSGIYFTQISILLNEVDGQLRLGEYYLLANRGERTWIGTYDETLGTNTTVSFSLPTGAEDLWFSGAGLDDRFLSTEDGFVDTVPVIPGDASAEVFFSYDLPFSGQVQLDRLIDKPVEYIEFLVSEVGGIEIQGSGITYQGVIEMDSGNALSYIAEPLNAGETLSYQVVSSTNAGSSGLGLEIGVGIVTLILSGLGIYILWRKPFQGVLPKEAEPILNEIANLDAAFDGRELPKKQYQIKRHRLINKIEKLVK